MPKQLTTLFTAYEFTEAELPMAAILTQMQECFYQTKIAELVQTKISLKFDPTNVLQFAQQEAELQGQINSLQWIIEMSNSVKAEEIAKNAARGGLPVSEQNPLAP